MPKLTKEEIRDRLQTDSVWVTTAYTNLSRLTHAGIAQGLVPERMLRYVVALYINGDGQAARDLEVSTLVEGGTAGTVADHTVKFSDIKVPAADNRQIPEGAYDIEDPIFAMAGGTRGPYGRVSGNSLNVTTIYWDSDL